MKVFIDFDDVLFNTRDFKKDLINIFIKNGVSKKQFIGESYWDGKYDLEKQIESLEKKYKINGDKLKKDTEYFFKDLKHYIFKDAVMFLEKIGRKNLFLISYGQKDFQLEKIKKSGIGDYFNQIIITTDKVKSIKKILKEEKTKKEKIYFLDDKNQYIKEVKKALPRITTILVKRPEGRYQDESDKMADITIEKLLDHYW